MTTTIQLDPAALEAAARTICNRFWGYDGADSVLIAGDGTEQWVEFKDEATDTITAYLAAIEPQVRAAVVEVIKATGEVSDAAEGFAFNPTDEQAVQINEAQDNLDRTEAALFALLGMTETTSETTENKGH